MKRVPVSLLRNVLASLARVLGVGAACLALTGVAFARYDAARDSDVEFSMVARGGFLAANSDERELRRREQELRRAGLPPQGRPARDELRRPNDEPGVDDRRRAGQLSPDERRALRREIDDAGRDVYRAPRGNR